MVQINIPPIANKNGTCLAPDFQKRCCTFYTEELVSRVNRYGGKYKISDTKCNWTMYKIGTIQCEKAMK